MLFYTYYPDMKGVRGYHSSQAYQLGAYFSIVRHYAGRNWRPPEIGIEYPVVPATAEALYPGTRILARQPYGYMAVPRAILHLPPPVPADLAAGGIEAPPPLTREFDYVETLRALLRPHLHEGYPDATLAASLMDTSVRTLARRLEEAGTAYRVLVDELRFTEARKLLQVSNAQVIDVAAAVGFTDPSHFARMFRRVGGLSPREFRRGQGQRYPG